MNASFVKKILDSCVAENTYILFFALVCLVFFFICRYRASDGKIKNHQTYKYYLNTHICYELFQSIVSIFPLLGLFGTVSALLNIDFSNEITGAQDNFFEALTSTALGIMFAVSGKILNAFIAPRMERLFEKENNITRERKPAEKVLRK